MSNSQKMRIKWIDMAKGMGILLVMISHFCGIPYVGNFVFGGYMQMFFLLSGYTMKVNNDVSTFWTQKIRRLLVPYFMYGFIIIIINALFEILRGNFSFNSLLSNCCGLLYSRFSLYPLGTDGNINFLKCFNSPFWFLTAMLVSYLWVFLFFKQNNKKKKIVLVVVYILCAIGLEQLPILLPWSFDVSFVGGLLIIIGYYLKEKDFFAEKLGVKIVTALALYIAVVLINGDINMSVRQYGELPIVSCFLFILQGVLFMIVYCGILQLINNRVIQNSLSWLGKHTIFILCFHLIIGYIIDVFSLPINNIYIMATVKVIIVICICMLYEVFKGKVVTLYEKKHIIKSGTGNNN